MRVVIRIIVGLVLSIAVLLAIGFLLPRQYAVERSVEIAAPPAKIFPFWRIPAHGRNGRYGISAIRK